MVPEHSAKKLSSQGTLLVMQWHGHHRKDCLGCVGAAELHRAYCLAALARHSRGKKGKATQGAEGKKTPTRKRLINPLASHGRTVEGAL